MTLFQELKKKHLSISIRNRSSAQTLGLSHVTQMNPIIKGHASYKYKSVKCI